MDDYERFSDEELADDSIEYVICVFCGDFVEIVDAIENLCVDCQHAQGIEE